jgi:hypothetical protein
VALPAGSRTPRLIAALAISAAVVAVVPAVQGSTPSVEATAKADAPLSQTLSGEHSPAPATAPRRVKAATATTRRPAPTRTTQVAPTTTTMHPRVLHHAEHGKAAIRALGSRLPAVARTAGWSPAKLRSVLSTDASANVSDTGRVFYREDDLTDEASADPQTAQAAAVAPAYPTSQTFALHSRASATRKIFLDFDGAVVTNTGWNGTAAGKTPNGTHTGFDLDGNPGTFSAAEHGYVQEVWRQVSEDYAPYDVDVTTQDPGLAGITRSSSSDTSYGTQVVITNDPTPRTDLCSGSCLGVAYVGTFDNVDSSGYYQPAWVFNYSTSFDPMIIAQAAAHEVGHTLGLSHDGTSTAGYSFGTAAWGPIMGGAMNRAVSQWSQGEYANANNQQDDLQVIQSNGLPLRADDHAGTTALGAQASYGVSGVISTRTDTDDFSVSLPCTTTLTVNAQGIGKQTALDLSLTVLNSSGQTVASSSPMSTFSGNPPVSAGMDASVSIPDATGTYTLRVDGVGNGSPMAAGWSDYGSLGQYTMTSTGCSATSTPALSPSVPVPSLAPVGTSVGAPDPIDQSGSQPPSPGRSPASAKRAPGAPRVAASSGAKGGSKTATARWSAPSSSGGTAITGYRVQALRLDKHGRLQKAYSPRRVSARARALVIKLPAGRYRFRVQAVNAVGASRWSALSHVVLAR